jgi:hypothetical protein
MSGKTVSLCALSMLAVVLAACSGDSKKVGNVDPNLFPTDYKREIFTTLTKELADPTGVRDSGITEPMLRQAGQEQRYMVCVRTNSRDATRVYTGVKERVAYFYGGHLNQFVEATQGQCANVVYQPWPELEKFCLSKSCT